MTLTIRMGGYGPRETTFSRGLENIKGSMSAEFRHGVDVQTVWNVMDFGYGSEDIVWLVESGVLTLGYYSTSGLSGRVPEMGIPDLPFLFRSTRRAREAIDGAFGTFIASSIEKALNVRVLGFFENGFRHISNRRHPVKYPADLAGMTLRCLNSEIQARTFELLGARPTYIPLSALDASLRNQEIDAQENPLANTLAYGVHKHHRFHTLTNHFYISRAIFAHRDTFDAYPREIQDALRRAVQAAIGQQRDWAAAEELRSREQLEAYGCEFVDLEEKQAADFRAVVRPIYQEARQRFGSDYSRVESYLG